MAMNQRALVWVLVATGWVSCAAPDGDGRRRDTLVTVAERPTRDEPPTTRANKSEPTGFTIRAEIGPAGGAASVSPPLLALVTPDGRIAGYDTASREHRFLVKGAAEDSSRTADDDDDNDERPSRAPAGAQKPAIIDRRELAVPGQSGGGWTLVVVATDAGRFRLRLQLFAHDVESGAVHETETTLALAKGDVRRFSVRIDAHTFNLAPLP